MAMTQTVSEEARAKVVDLVARLGFGIQLNADGNDVYVKVLKLWHPASSNALYIHKDRGVTPAGRFDSYRVVVHPEDYVYELDGAASGISLPVNSRTGTNRFSSSNYAGYPSGNTSREPSGRAYEAKDLASLERLLMNLATHWSGRRAAHDPGCAGERAVGSSM
jgi:hypothetical protein